MIKDLAILICLLLLSSGCVSRTISSADSRTGTRREVISEKKVIWFWQKDFYK
jgi:hypothetical protein